VTGGAVEAVLAELDRLVPEGPTGVAVSGGGDSTALLIVAVHWARARGRALSAATVDHRLRPESAAEAAAVAALCSRLGIPHQTLHAADLSAAGGNLPAAAREARFALLGDWAREEGLTSVLLGHTMDDQAETVLMRLARGSGAEGLSAMQPVLERGGMVWLRPLLGIRRAALRELLEAEGVRWIEDPTNEDPEYDRVKARRALAALAPLGIDAEGLARTAWHLRRQRRVLERAMDELARRARHYGTLGEIRLDIAALRSDEHDTALRLLADSLLRVSGAVYRPRFRPLSDVLEAILAGEPAGRSLAGCLILPEGAQVLICREPAACAEPLPLRPGANRWDRRWRVTVAGAWPAASLGALGEAGLAALRAAADAGHWSPPDSWSAAPRLARLTTPAVWRGERLEPADLLAVPLAGFLDRDRLGPDCTITAEDVVREELHAPAQADYGPAGSRSLAP
jgi:tRNA(Ile)-lysidine synthase